MAIDSLGNEGEGIGRYRGFTFFVKDAIPGDVILARVLKLKKNYGYARVEKVLSASPDRVEPLCPVARQCGGCQLQHLSYARQLDYKQDKIKNCLERIGGLTNVELEPIIGMEVPYYYSSVSSRAWKGWQCCDWFLCGAFPQYCRYRGVLYPGSGQRRADCCGALLPE